MFVLHGFAPCDWDTCSRGFFIEPLLWWETPKSGNEKSILSIKTLRAIMVNIDFSVFAFSSKNSYAIPGKTCICNVLPVPSTVSNVTQSSSAWKRYRSLEIVQKSCRTVLNSKNIATSTKKGLLHKCCWLVLLIWNKRSNLRTSHQSY